MSDQYYRNAEALQQELIKALSNKAQQLIAEAGLQAEIKQRSQ